MRSNASILATAAIVGLLTLISSLGSARADEKEKAAPTKVTHADAKEAAKLVGKKEVVVLDVRTPKEFSAGHIAGATNIDFQAGDFAKRLAKLDREQTYLVHCAVGGRSTKALPQFSRLGFKHVIHLDGGFKAWQAAGNAVERK